MQDLHQSRCAVAPDEVEMRERRRMVQVGGWIGDQLLEVEVRGGVDRIQQEPRAEAHALVRRVEDDAHLGGVGG